MKFSPVQESRWTVEQLTHGSAEGRYHSHAYYDIPVFDATSRYLVCHQVRLQARHPKPEDRIIIGTIDTEDGGRWQSLGETSAWSWQQGALSQWVPGSRRCVWNIRADDGFAARMYDLANGATTTLPAPVYALTPDGRTALSLDMTRLNRLRPGYGYASVGTSAEAPLAPCPDNEGVRAIDLETGNVRLVLSLRRAVKFLYARLGLKARLKHALKRYVYWFNHAKVSPDGSRFTIKLRYRKPGKRWTERQGVSLTCGLDGTDLRLLADATSHVIWLDDKRLYFYRHDGVYLYADEAPRGRYLERLAPEIVSHNVHMRHLPDDPQTLIFDTPYREQIDLLLYHCRTRRSERIAQFHNHRPARGPFRCDLHPCPSPDGSKVVVTSLNDGARQVYLLRRR